jgi:hypothetical protein
MSDMWQVPEGLAESLLEPDPCADARNDAWANGVEAGKEYVGRILTDLIAELGRLHRLERRRYRRRCADCGQEWPCHTNVTISYSLGRLREVQGE